MEIEASSIFALRCTAKNEMNERRESILKAMHGSELIGVLFEFAIYANKGNAIAINSIKKSHLGNFDFFDLPIV